MATEGGQRCIRCGERAQRRVTSSYDLEIDDISATGRTGDVSAGSLLLGPAEIRSLAAAAGVTPTKRLGQNFLHDANTIQRIVRTAGVQPGARVLEVGPGFGSLTFGLIEAGAHVTAVEIDPVLAAALGSRAARHGVGDRLTVVVADALRVHELPGPAPELLVANLPYNVSVPVVLHLLEAFPALSGALVLVQAEVGQRLAAGPGSKIYGVPSVKAAWYADVTLAGNVARSVFWPVPNVDSVLVRLTRRPPPDTAAARTGVFGLIDAAFAQRRKMLRSTIAAHAGSPDAAARALEAAGIDATARGETLGVEDFVRLASALAATARND